MSIMIATNGPPGLDYQGTAFLRDLHDFETGFWRLLLLEEDAVEEQIRRYKSAGYHAMTLEEYNEAVHEADTEGLISYAPWPIRELFEYLRS